jgi:OOP family OmpA-OmpF porin
VSGIVAKGYGEADPIADNSTEAGREANRRIEFRLLVSSQPVTPDQAKLAAETGTDAPVAATNPDAADFSGDTSPSVAPTKMTVRPKPRPEKFQ